MLTIEYGLSNLVKNDVLDVLSYIYMYVYMYDKTYICMQLILFHSGIIFHYMEYH